MYTYQYGNRGLHEDYSFLDFRRSSNGYGLRLEVLGVHTGAFSVLPYNRVLRRGICGLKDRNQLLQEPYDISLM